MSLLQRSYSCTECLYRVPVAFHPIIGYGRDPEISSVTRVDESKKVCKDCIKKIDKERPVGRIVDWVLVEEYEDD